MGNIKGLVVLLLLAIGAYVAFKFIWKRVA